MSRKYLRKFWLNLHLVIALTVGFWFVVLGLTGACNVFYAELREWPLAEVKPREVAQSLPLDRILQAVKARHPQRDGSWSLLLPGYGSDYLWVNYPKPVETQNELFAPLEILIDPDSGDIVDQRFWGRSLPGMIYELHADLLLGPISAELGEIGFRIVCWSGVALLLSCLSGLCLWWPRSGKFGQALRIKPKASIERFFFDLHKVVGIYSIVWLLIIAFTGFSFGYRDSLEPLVKLFSDVKAKHLQEPKLKSTFLPNVQSIDITQALNVAERVFPNAELRMVTTPQGRDGVYMIAKRQVGEANRKRSRSKVWIDQYSGKVLAVQDPNQFTAGETFMNILWPLHDGQILGLPGRILWCFAGITPLVLYVTGILRWLQKRRAAKKKLVKLTTSP
jgi:uncharacterized iron-regulated membrane protein